MSAPRIKAAILGTGNIGTDLMFKILKNSGHLELTLFAGIDAKSDGIARAKNLGVNTSSQGLDAVLDDPEIKIVYDATSARAHLDHAPKLKDAGKMAIDLTPAAVGPYVVPSVNMDVHLNVPNVNLITCGGQATIPMVYAMQRVTPLDYAEIVSTVASCSAGPGTRQNIDEFTFTTACGLEKVGGARRGKAIIILNPANPPVLMRNTIYAIPSGEFDEVRLTESIEQMVVAVQAYVPGYKLKGTPLFEDVNTSLGTRRGVTILLEVAGAGDYLPSYAGNLDIMTAAAWQIGQAVAAQRLAHLKSSE